MSEQNLSEAKPRLTTSGHQKASLKELLSEKDLALLVDYDGDPPQWAVGVTQKNSDADRFLGGMRAARLVREKH